MKSILLVVLLATAATAAVISNEVPDVVKPDVTNGDDVADVDLHKMPAVFVTDVNTLVVAADLTDVPEDITVASRLNLSSGLIGSSDLWLYGAEHRSGGLTGHITTREITILTNARLTAIRVTRIGDSQNATPSIESGGVGNSSVVIRIRSAIGRGFAYRVVVWGK